MNGFRLKQTIFNAFPFIQCESTCVNSIHFFPAQLNDSLGE